MNEAFKNLMLGGETVSAKESVGLSQSKQYAMEETLIKGTDISLKYGDKQILRDVNFEVKNITRPGMAQGQVVALIGRSGIGKSQLFRILSGLNKPTTGTLLIDTDQHPVTAGEVGIIPQNYILLNHRTIRTNLMLGMSHSGKKRTAAEADALIKQYAEAFDLMDHLDKYPAQLSGGQKQRVSIIQQVLTDNKFILLDEPFSGLDSLMVDKVIHLLIKISTLNEYNTLVIISHDIESSMAIADTVWVLAKEPEKEGATITRLYDLAKMGLAWDPDIRTRTEFQKLVATVKTQL
jgi:ABC-type nitrate/sulfonate/bicarbonate transport system ATPase subunit